MTFSLELSDDVIEVRDWVHDFAEKVVRPAAAEWDEREETPWPIIQEAAKVGLYSVELFATQAAEPSGLGLLTVFEETFWGGDAGIALSILGTGLAAASLAATGGLPSSWGEWLPPQMFGTVDEPPPRLILRVGAGRRFGRVGHHHPRPVRRGQRRVDHQRHQDVGDQRRHCQRAHRRRVGLPPRIGVPRSGHVHHSAGGPRASARAKKFKKHGIRASHTAEVVLDDVRIPGRLIIGGKDKFDERIARRARARAQPVRPR